MLLAANPDRSENFVELDVPGWAWVALLVVIVLMLAIDLFRHREAHAPTPREALTESLVWVACGLAFAVAMAVVHDLADPDAT